VELHCVVTLVYDLEISIAANHQLLVS